MYDVFIRNLKYKQNYKDKWKSSLDLDIDDNDWNLINMNVTKITQDTTLRWLQYRIIHRCIGTNNMLFRFNMLSSNLCTFCNENPETILHLFCDCKHVEKFWKDLELWLFRNCNIQITFSKNDICLMKKMYKNQHLFNLIIILAKKHIYKQKLNKSKPTIGMFLIELKSCYFIEKSIYFHKKKYLIFKSRWNLLSYIFENND